MPRRGRDSRARRAREIDRQPAPALRTRRIASARQLEGRPARPTRLRDPTTQKWNKDAARALDRGFNALVGAKPLDDFVEPADDRLQAWPEGRRRAGRPAGRDHGPQRARPDSGLFRGRSRWPTARPCCLTDQRPRLHPDRAKPAAVARHRDGDRGPLSVLLSLFLARTIVRPLRRIALAAHRVRLGRAREVRVPRLPSRSDEIGLLARAVSDMSQSLRHRIDNIEAFAADVTHELKNPLASLRSAVDGLDRVEDPELQQQAARRRRARRCRPARPPDRRHQRGRANRRRTGPRQVRAGRPRPADRAARRLLGASPRERRCPHRLRPAAQGDSAIVLGEPSRLARAIDNIIDNAISFSPPGGLVEIAAARVGDEVRIRDRRRRSRRSRGSA